MHNKILNYACMPTCPRGCYLSHHWLALAVISLHLDNIITSLLTIHTYLLLCGTDELQSSLLIFRQKSFFLPTEPQHRSWQRVVHSLFCWQLLQKLRVTDLFYQLTWTQQTTSCLLSSLHWKTAQHMLFKMMYYIDCYCKYILICIAVLLRIMLTFTSFMLRFCCSIGHSWDTQ